MYFIPRRTGYGNVSNQILLLDEREIVLSITKNHNSY